jgi:hypothetical protein
MQSTSSPFLRAQVRTEAEALRAIYSRRASDTARNMKALREAAICRIRAANLPPCLSRELWLTDAARCLRMAKVARLSSTMGARLP